MATSIGDALSESLWDELRSHRTIETAEGVAIGVVVAGLVSWFFQHVVQVQRAVARGHLLQVCPAGAVGEPAPVPVPGGQVVAIGTAGPAAGGVFDTSTSGDGSWSMTLPPGLYIVGATLPSGHQLPPMVATPHVAAGQLPLLSGPELIYDVWAQMLLPADGAVVLDLVVPC